MRHLVFALALLVPATALAEDYDPSIDECALPGADCDPTAVDDPDEASLEAADMAEPDDDPVDWTTAVDAVRCAEGAENIEGLCVPTDASIEVGGCATGTAGLALGIVVIAFAVRRRKKLAPLVIVVACSVGDSSTWDEAVDAGPTGDDTYLDVYSADLGDDGSQILLAEQALVAGAKQPIAQLALSRVATGKPMYRTGDRLTTERTAADELLGWASPVPGDGTAELVELQSPAGGFAYETSAESIDTLVAEGYTISNRLGHVWPPGIGDAIVPDDDATEVSAAPKPCSVSIHSATRSPLIFLYASPGADESERFLKGCPGEVVIGEKRESGPRGRMSQPESKVAGGRTAFVLDRHGDKLRELLLRTNGVERTRQYLKKKLAAGYEYIAIDEITAAPDFRDGATLNRRLRKLVQRMPRRIFIPYISIDLTQQVGGFEAMKARRLLLRTFKLRARAIVLEIYLHTDEVMAGAAPLHFRRAADRLALAVSGLRRAGGINLRAISSPATSMHSTFPQYRYLDNPKHDLAAIKRQVNAIRHGSKRTRQQNGLGYYFVNKSDMAPRANAPYSYDRLIRVMRLQALRFKK